MRMSLAQKKKYTGNDNANNWHTRSLYSRGKKYKLGKMVVFLNYTKNETQPVSTAESYNNVNHDLLQRMFIAHKNYNNFYDYYDD